MLPLEEMRQFIIEKTRSNAAKFGDRMPTATQDGQYKFAEDGFWVGGFWTALCTLAYEWTKDESFIEAARASQHRLKKRLYEKTASLDHDIGFLYELSFVADYKATGSAEARRVALDAAEVLAKRYNERGRFINAWNVWSPGDAFSENNRGRIIADCMYNLPFLFWAAEETGDERFRRIAMDHADVNARTIVRPDYTTYHTYLFDPATGEPRRGETHQGYADESCWSRGQAWTIGGYAHAYRYTGKKEYLELARKLTDVFLSKLEDDLVPMWDFSLPTKEGEPRDTSAAAIAAASMLEMANHLPAEDAAKYTDMAQRIVESLYKSYTTQHKPEEEGLLLEACGHKPKNVDLVGSLIYGDYYFAEAVARLSGARYLYW